jgi:hypothetical protein
VDQTKSSADDSRISEESPDLLGTRVGADIEILRLPLQEQVADGAAHHVGLEATMMQPIQNLDGVEIDVLA